MTIHRNKHMLDKAIKGEEKKFLQWAMSQSVHREFFITQTFIGGIQPNSEKSIRTYILTFLLNLANNIGKEVYAIGGSWNKASPATSWMERASHFHLMVSVPLILPSSVVMSMGNRDRNGNKLYRWGRHTCAPYDPDRGGFPYILTRHEWETFAPIYPKR